MPIIKLATREIICKIVYYGPGRSGKTTNLQYIHRKVPAKKRSEMVSLATAKDRTLFFDFLPIDVGIIGGYEIKFQLFTVPGQVYYNATRKLVLQGADGIVFVADSQKDRLEDNMDSWANMFENLEENGANWEEIPIVIQYNKQDLPSALQPSQISPYINKYNFKEFPASAVKGNNVIETLKFSMSSVLEVLKKKYE